jgi:aspartate aminotransferase
MLLSSRVKESNTSITLKVNEKINKLTASGRHIYNMTSGQLNVKPSIEFIESISKQLNFSKSYQYSPNSGMKKLREKFMNQVEDKRGIKFNTEESETEFECIISNGSKHSLYNVFGALLNPGDEVIILTPYWVSYPEIVKFWGGTPIVVKSHAFDAYTPPIDEIEKVISARTKAIILNSPNNPAGIHYPDDWMKEFAGFVKKHKDLLVISDEVYSELSYFDPKPSYFYQYAPETLKQTIIINSISKSFASTGLRIGYCIADAKLTKAMAKIQSQTTSGPNSLIQRALIDFDFGAHDKYFDPIKEQLRVSAQFLRKSFREVKLDHCFYQTTSSFYYLLDFSRMPIYEKFKDDQGSDFSTQIVEDILENIGVALVPGSAFGYPNSARMSLTLEELPFQEAIKKLSEYLSMK